MNNSILKKSHALLASIVNSPFFKKYYAALFCIALASFSILIRVPDFERQGFRNSDATWRVLHTLNCYDETPVSVHKFLPIVTLGTPEDKWISWGTSIPDQYGNYYDTSFSPAGFVAPYLFMKALHIPISLMGLYAFNSLLLVLSFVFAARLFQKLFQINKNYLWMITAVAYLLQNEVILGQGVTYWSQSLYQLIFLIQLNILFSPYSHAKYVGVLFLTLVGAYTDWTGYCVAIGIALFYLYTDKTRWQGIVKAIGILIFAFLAFGLFCLHYLSVLNPSGFKTALKEQFLANSVANNIPFLQLLDGYLNSFVILLFVTFYLASLWFITRKSIKPFLAILKNHKWLFIVLIFALSENIILMPYAVAHSFDTMKAILFILAFMFCSIEIMVLHLPDPELEVDSLRWVLCLVSVFLAMDLLKYKVANSPSLIYDNPELAVQKTIAEEINEKFDRENSILAYDSEVNGYLSTTFDRGIYENLRLGQAVQIAANKEKRYAVALQKDFTYAFNDLASINCILDLTDENWTHGVLNSGSILLFAETPLTRSALLEQTPTTLVVDGREYPVTSVNVRPDGYIGITMADHETALKFAYPARFEIVY
ncbi:MAG: hypothetical protein LBT59_22055 [Clostridiales bacterium]|jgi:hypothetical protein|nr:hypothetical protein [Clostridiales bacterium]